MNSSRRLILALLIGLLSGLVAWGYHASFQRGGGDIAWAMCAARALVAGEAPYSPICATMDSQGEPLARYPLTTALVVAPFAILPSPLAAGVFIALSASLLAWGLLASGQTWRLLIFLSFPAIACIQVANWSLLLLAALYVPGLAVLAVAKPHVGAPILFIRAWANPWPYLVGAGSISLLSLLIRPSWPLEFLASTSGYTGGPILLSLPFGPLVLLALARWRQGSAGYLLIYALVPLRPFYDWLLLAPVFATRRWLLIWVSASWLGYAAFYFGQPQLVVLAIWGPAVVAVLREHPSLPWRQWTVGLL